MSQGSLRLAIFPSSSSIRIRSPIGASSPSPCDRMATEGSRSPASRSCSVSPPSSFKDWPEMGSENLYPGQPL